MKSGSGLRYVFPLSEPWQNCKQTTPCMQYVGGSNHFGWDICPLNFLDANVLAACGGTVEEIQYLTTSYGNHVWVKGDDGKHYVYAHLKPGTIKVYENQRVESGNIIGQMGESGNADGKHLHLGIFYEIHGFDGRINPANYLGFNDAVANLSIRSGSAVHSQNSTGTDANGSTAGNVPYASQAQPMAEIDILDIVEGSFEKGEYLFGRRCRVVVSAEDGTAVDLSNLHVVFSLQKTYLTDIQFSVVDIYNASRDTENFIISKAHQITIEAGYEGKYFGHIYTGDVVQAYGFNENGADFVLRIISADNERFVSQSFVNFSWMRGMTQRKQVENLLAQATVTSTLNNISEDAGEISLPRGKAFFGMTHDYLKQTARNIGGSYYNDNGTVNIVKAEDLEDNRIFNLTPKTGLIGTPQQEDMGISGRCLLIPQIRINTAIRVENQYIRQKQLTWGSSTGVSAIGSATGDGSSTTSVVTSVSLSSGLIGFVKAWEKLRLTAYWDEEGYSIGYGHQDGTIKEGDTCTEEQANAWLAQDLAKAAEAVNDTRNVPFTSELSPYQKEVLISFEMNTGLGWLQTLCRNRTKDQIMEYFPNYCHGSSNNVLPGLQKRRSCEMDVWRSGACVYEGKTYVFAGADGASMADISTNSGSNSEDVNAIQPLDKAQIYRVVRLKYNGDTRGENWYIEFEGYRQTGLVPAILNTVGD